MYDDCELSTYAEWVYSASNSRIMTAHLAHKAHDAIASRLIIVVSRCKRKRAQAKFQMCVAHLVRIATVKRMAVQFF
ncbi:hypothetical protein EB001_00485 [bacterium]|nr:hypothetical protein [bacterium]